MNIELGERLFSFDSFENWCDTAARKFKKASTSSTDTVCVDQRGRLCGWGEHFIVARDGGAFPVDVYLLRADMKAKAAA